LVFTGWLEGMDRFCCSALICFWRRIIRTPPMFDIQHLLVGF
jgi:hypothetical protein